jgi:hypothetical protein
MDPRVKSGTQALAQQFALSKRLYDAVVDIHEMRLRLDRARERAQAAGNTELVQRLTELAGVAAVGRGGFGRAAITSPLTVADVSARLLRLYALTQDGSGSIPVQTVAAAEEALKQYDALMAQVTTIIR